MPTYSYTCPCGRTFSEFKHSSEDCGAPATCECGKAAPRDIAAEHAPHQHGTGYPVLSTSLGCQPREIAKQEEHYAKLGIPTKFAPDGRCIITSWAHRKALHKQLGAVDLS